METTVEPEPSVMDSIVQEIFNTMVGLPISTAEASIDKPSGDNVTGNISICGERKYAVLLKMPEALACRITATMLDEKVDGWSDSVEDTVGELVNMIGGNLKAHLSMSKGSALSLPSVTHGQGYETHSPGTKPLLSRTFLVEDHVLSVSLSAHALSTSR